jgi:hypothetical protein
MVCGRNFGQGDIEFLRTFMPDYLSGTEENHKMLSENI